MILDHKQMLLMISSVQFLKAHVMVYVLANLKNLCLLFQAWEVEEASFLVKEEVDKLHLD